MKGAWLHKNDRKSLILFCNGWGMDGNPFRQLTSIEFDVYMLYDYRQLALPPEVDRIVPQYEHIHLIGWSMGVWAGQKLFAERRAIFDRTLAVNGTLCPIDDRYGIPEEIFAETLAGFGEAARFKFYRRMCREKSNFRSFLAKQPRRTLDDQREELAALRDKADCIGVDEALYREIIIAEYDWIIPSENQKKFWQGRAVKLVSGFHYLFNLWQSWDHLLAFSEAPPRQGLHSGTVW
ncbi:MAG: hypothetical protein ACD_75C01518G0002 [uncultured bacterium]|nr:MAG: hypothetical protein ACD_75C01518G0002 [uncultured bacterium]